MSPEIEYVPYSAKELTDKLRSEYPQYFTFAPDAPKFPNELLRIHRSIRWFERAEKESDDPDAAFIFCWIAFNASYARDMPGKPLPEAKEFQSFIRKINRIDTENVIANYVMRESSQTIVSLGRVDTMNLTQRREGAKGAKMRLLRCYSGFLPRHSRESGNPEGSERCLCTPSP